MGPLRQLLACGDTIGVSAHVEALWARRHENGAFGLTEADDAAWVLANTAQHPDLQLQLWPHLLGLLTRWAYAQYRSAGQSTAQGVGANAKDTELLGSLCSLLSGFLASQPDAAWAARAPALLLLAVVGSTALGPSRLSGAAPGVPAPGAAGNSPNMELQLRNLACSAICGALMRSPRRAGATSNGSMPTVATAAAGAYLSSTWPAAAPASAAAAAAAAASAVASSAITAVGGGAGAVDATLLLPTASAVTDLCTAVQMVLEVVAADGDGRLFLALLSALMDTLASELGGLVWRTAAAAADAAAGAGAAGAAAAAVATAKEAAVAALAALHAAFRQLAGSCVRSVATRTVGAAVGAGPVMAMLAVAAEQVRATAAATMTAVAPPGLPEKLRATAGLSLARAVSAVAAGGLLEGVLAAARLQPPASQAALLRALQPASDRLVAALLDASGAAAVVAVEAAVAASAGPGGLSGPSGPSGPAAVAGVASSVLRQAVGYCWARLRLQPSLHASEVAPAPAVVAERMAEAAALAPVAAGVGSMPAAGCAAQPGGQIGGSGSGSIGGWHPGRGALELLFGGALGLGRIVSAALEGAPPTAVHEALVSHSQGPLYGDMQSLARGALEALAAARQQASAAAGAVTTPGGGAAAAAAAAQAAAGGLATGLLHDTAAAAQRLHVLYGAVADSDRGATWLATLPPPASGLMRELIDRSFVCVVSVTSAAFDALSVPDTMAAASPPPALRLPAGAIHLQLPPHAAIAAGETAAAVVAALGALADVQFCGLQLRAHGDLVGRLSAAVMAAPEAAAAPLLALLPCYPAFASAYAAGGAGGSGGGVAVSRVAFLLPLAASCVPFARDVGVAAAVVLPFVYLLLKGSGSSHIGGAGSEAVCQAAHAVWAALLAALCGDPWNGQQEGAAYGDARQRHGHGAGANAGTGRAACEEVAASMVPYYLQRSCQQPCGPGDVELMQRGLMQAFKSLPANHPVKAWCVVRMAQQLSEWGAAAEPVAAAAAAAAVAAAAAPRGMLMGPAAGPTAAAPPLPPQVALVQSCGIALAVLMTDLDFALLPRGFAALDSLLLPAHSGDLRTGASSADGGLASETGAATVMRPLPPACRTAALQLLHDVWLRCDDHARKPLLDWWLRGAVAALPPAPRRAAQEVEHGAAASGGSGVPWLRVLLL